MIHTFPKKTDGSLYLDLANIVKPGDVIQLDGDYTFIRLFNVKGTAENPIRIVTKNKTRIGGHKSYQMTLQGSEHVKIVDGNITFGHDVLCAFAIAPGDISGFELANAEIYNVQAGILQNPSSGRTMKDNFYHHLHIHSLSNPASLGRSEAFYLGNTSGSTNLFENCRIEDCLLENLSGDGVQVCQGSFDIKRVTVRNYGTAKLSSQNNGVLIGGSCTANLEDSIIEKGFGPALQILGRGEMNIKGNKFLNNDTTATKEDTIYINGKTATSTNKLKINFSGNEFSGNVPGRKVITNATAETLNAGITYTHNKGLDKASVSLAKADVFTAYEPPTKTITEIITVYSDGSTETRRA